MNDPNEWVLCILYDFAEYYFDVLRWYGFMPVYLFADGDPVIYVFWFASTQ